MLWLVRNGGAIPMRRESPVLLICPAWPKAEDAGTQSILFDAMKRHCRQVRDHPIGLNPGKDEIERAVDQAKRDRTLVIGTINAHLNRGQGDLARGCIEVNPSAVVVSMANPYDLKSIPTQNAIATYHPQGCISDLVRATEALGHYTQRTRLARQIGLLFASSRYYRPPTQD